MAISVKEFIANQQLEFDLYFKSQLVDAKAFFAAQKEAGLNFIYPSFTRTKAEKRKRFSEFMDGQDAEYKAFGAKQKQDLEEFYKTQSIELEMFLKASSKP